MKLFNDSNLYNIKTKSKFSYAWKIIEPIIIYLGSIFILELILVLILSIIGIKGNKEAIAIIKNIEEPLISAITFIFIYKIYKKEKDNHYPIIEKSINKTYIIMGALIIMSLSPIMDYIVLLLEKVFPHIDDVYQETFNKSIQDLSVISNYLSICVFAPLIEEVVCRGLILNRLLAKNKIWVSILITALIFGVLHMNWSQGISAFLAGIVMCFVYVKTRNLKACILGHALNNVFALTLMYINLPNDIETSINILFIITGLILLYFFINSINPKLSMCKSKTVKE